MKRTPFTTLITLLCLIGMQASMAASSSGLFSQATSDSCDVIACNDHVFISVQQGHAYPTSPDMFLEGFYCRSHTYKITYQDPAGNWQPFDTIHFNLPPVFNYHVEDLDNGNACWGSVEMKFIGCNMAIACKGKVFFTRKIGESITPELSDFLEGTWCQDHTYSILYTDSTGNEVPLGDIDENTPEKFVFLIQDDSTGNACWGEACVLTFDCNKPFDPQVLDTTIRLKCNIEGDQPEVLGLPLPEHATVEKINNEYVSYDWNPCYKVVLNYTDVVTSVSCDSPYMRKLERTWDISEGNGNVLESVKYTYLFERIDIDSLPRLPNYDGIDRPILNCSDAWNTGNNIPTPDITGRPLASDYCQLIGQVYSDEIFNTSFDTCYTTIKILRKWTLIDWCTGAIKEHLQIIKVECDEDSTVPVAICRNGIQVKLGINGEITLWATDIDDGSYDNCGIANFSLDERGVISSRTFTISDIGTHTLDMYVWDLAGNKNYCRVLVEVLPNSKQPGNLGGRYLNYKLQPSNLQKQFEYEITNGADFKSAPNCQIPAGQNDLNYSVCVDDTNFPGPYFLAPYGEDQSPINGISTLDMVLVQRILLGRDPANIFKLIASDLNGNQSVSAVDLALMRAYILGKRSWTGPQWKFFAPDTINPTPIESIEITSIPDYTVDFVPVRIGDLSNRDLTGFKNDENQLRSSDTVKVYMEDVEMTAGSSYNVWLEVREPIEILGLQIGTRIDPSRVEVTAIEDTLDNGFSAIFTDNWRYVQNDVLSNAYELKGRWLQLTVKARMDGKLSEALNQYNWTFPSLVALPDHTEIPIHIEFTAPGGNDEVVMCMEDILLEDGNTYDVWIDLAKREEMIGLQIGQLINSNKVTINSVESPILSGGDEAIYKEEWRYVHLDLNLNTYSLSGKWLKINLTSHFNGRLSEALSPSVMPFQSSVVRPDFSEVPIRVEFKMSTSARNEFRSELQLTARPNPFSSHFEIQVDLHKSQSGVFEIFDLQGKSMYKKAFDRIPAVIELDGSLIKTTGMYLGVLQTEQGNHIIKLSKI